MILIIITRISGPMYRLASALVWDIQERVGVVTEWQAVDMLPNYQQLGLNILAGGPPSTLRIQLGQYLDFR
jgi:hypothetical protein